MQLILGLILAFCVGNLSAKETALIFADIKSVAVNQTDSVSIKIKEPIIFKKTNRNLQSVKNAKTSQRIAVNSSSQGGKKTTLYLTDTRDNFRAVWFYLGAFYAFETYGVQIDSIVASSYGAWLASLWKSGYSLDDMQRLLLSKSSRTYFSAVDKSQKNPLNTSVLLPLADSGFPAWRGIWAFQTDSSGLQIRVPSLELDSLAIAEMKFRLLIEESLYRLPLSERVAIQMCSGEIQKISKEKSSLSVQTIVSTFPFSGNVYGTSCALPLPDSENELSENAVILSFVPMRETGNESPENLAAFYYANRELSYFKESVLTVRPHSLQNISEHSVQKSNSAPQSIAEQLMQSGFSAVEQKLSSFGLLQKLKPYKTKSDSAVAWFKLKPVTDSVRSEITEHLLSFWNPRDTGIQAAENFISSVSETPVYDSLRLTMSSDGSVSVYAVSPFISDLRLGGFGSNIIGASAALDWRLRYVNQFEYELGLFSFYGMSGFGVTPEMRLLRLLNGKFDFGFQYVYRNIEPLHSYFSGDRPEMKILKEEKSDFSLSLAYRPFDCWRISLQALVGNRHYSFDSLKVRVRPLSPMLKVTYQSDFFDAWFGSSGQSLEASFGLESDGASFGKGETVPIYQKFRFAASALYSPLSFLTFGGGAAFGANMYNEDGEDFPLSFGYNAIDMTLRQAIEATPWSTEWYFSAFRSHEFMLLRAHVGLHIVKKRKDQKFDCGAWLFTAYIRDFENSPVSDLKMNRFVLEPALYLAYRSISVYVGMQRILNVSDAEKFTEFENYNYFIRVGNFRF